MVESALTSAMTRYLAARPTEEFIGRKEPMARLLQMARDAARGGVHIVALDGPRGAGKSELLRQLAVSLDHHADGILPIHLDLSSIPASRFLSPSGAEDDALRILFRSVLHQVLARTGKLDLAHAQWLEADPTRLAGFCYGSGLSHLASFASLGTMHISALEAWQNLLRAMQMHPLPVPVLILDGAGGSDDPAVSAQLSILIEAVRREGCSAFFEAATALDHGVGFPIEGLDVFPLGPLKIADGLALVQSVGQRRGWAIPESCLQNILPRLGPWPGWVRAWTAQVKALAFGANPIRAAEEAYVNFLTAGSWSDGLNRRFERLVPLHVRERVLRLVRAVIERKEPLTPDEAPAILGVAIAEAEQILHALTSLGLLNRQGVRWSAPQTSALSDWVRLVMAESMEQAGPSAARLDLLSTLLAQPRPAEDAAATGFFAELPLAEVVERFRGQMLTPVLFEFADYYEAVGRLSQDKRREAIMSATASMRLPEVIGVADWTPPSPVEGGARILYARTYREGKYQRSHEEIWILIDLSMTRLVTTPEVREALKATHALEMSLRPNKFVRWLILGEGASAEALELIQREQLHCSSQEQFAFIQELLTPQVPRAAQGNPPEAARPAHPEVPAAAEKPYVRPAIIDLDREKREPSAETSELTLPARDGSELIAALMGEKIAIRSDFDASQAGQIKTSVLEGVLNAIEHSPNREKLIYIQFIVKAEALEVTIENEGSPFDPLAVPTPDPQAKLVSPHKRGWGLSLMKRFMDEVGYEPCTRGTRLRLVKRRRQIRTDQGSQEPKSLRG